MAKSKNKSLTLTVYAWVGFLLMIAGVVILIFGLVPDAPFKVEFETFKMSTPQTGLVLTGIGALIGYLATKNSDVTVYSGETTKDQKFKRNLGKASIIIGVLAVILLIVFYILNF